MVRKAANSIISIEKPALLRKRKKSNYSILQYVISCEEQISNAYYPKTADDYFKPIYFEALDPIINAIEDRFEQPPFKKFMNFEELLLKAIHKTDLKELKVLESDFHRDFNRNQIESELHLIPTIFKNSKTLPQKHLESK